MHHKTKQNGEVTELWFFRVTTLYMQVYYNMKFMKVYLHKPNPKSLGEAHPCPLQQNACVHMQPSIISAKDVATKVPSLERQGWLYIHCILVKEKWVCTNDTKR